AQHLLLRGPVDGLSLPLAGFSQAERDRADPQPGLALEDGTLAAAAPLPVLLLAALADAHGFSSWSGTSIWRTIRSASHKAKAASPILIHLPLRSSNAPCG